MKSKLLLTVVLAGCVGEMETETETQSQAATSNASAIACYELDPQNALCQLGDVRFESQDLGLSNCVQTRAGLICDALKINSPNLPPELWEGYVPTSNGGIWKTSNLTCVDASLVCDSNSLVHCWCEAAAAKKKSNVEMNWKVEEGQK